MTETFDAGQLAGASRPDLDAIATEAGVAEPENLPNKKAVIAAIAAAHGEPQPVEPVTFAVLEGLNGVMTGASPRVVVRAGSPYTTDDPAVIARLDKHPCLVRVDGGERQ